MDIKPSRHQDMLSGQAYSLLNLMGGYVFSNLQGPTIASEETASNVSRAGLEGKENIVNDEEDDDNDVDCTSPVVDEKALIKQKIPFEQKFIREHRNLFSETLNPNRYMSCPPMQKK